MTSLRCNRSNPADPVLLDIRMPEMDGYKVCRHLKANEQTREIPVIFISALHHMEDKLQAFRASGFDYVAKPFQAEEVLARVKAHLNLYRLQCDLQSIIDERTSGLRLPLESLKESQQKFANFLEETILAISMTTEKREPYNAGQQWWVSLMAAEIARELDMSPERIEGFRLGAMVHDIGKIYVPVDILSHPGALSNIKFSLIKTHPQGLKGQDIILEARIIAIADVVEATASHRAYRPSLGLETALQAIREGAGAIYNTDVATACTRLFAEKAYSVPDTLH